MKTLLGIEMFTQIQSQYHTASPTYFWAWSWLLQPVSSWLRLLDMSAPVARTAARFSGRFLHSEAQTYTSAWLLCARRQARASRSSGSRIGPRMPWWAALALQCLPRIFGTNRMVIFCNKKVGLGIYMVYIWYMFKTNSCLRYIHSIYMVYSCV